MDLYRKEAESRKNIQLICLVAAGMVPFAAMLVDALFPGLGLYLAQKLIIVPCLLFFGSALTQPLSPMAKKGMLLSAVSVLWYAAAQLQHHLNHMETGNFGLFAVAYLLAFPFAMVTEDGEENVGLKWIGGIHVAFSLLMAGLTALLLLEAVPSFLSSRVLWAGARASVFWHPNGSAFVLMLGIGFSLYFLAQQKNKWKKYAMGVLIALQFCTITLTNSRTTIFLSCALIAGTVFFAIWKGSWKQFLAGAVAAVAILAILLFAYNGLFDLHKQAQIDKLLKQEEQKTEQVQNQPAPAVTKPKAEKQSTEEDQKTTEEAPKTKNNQKLRVDKKTGEITIVGAGGTNQKSLSKDLGSLNGRTKIWKAAFSALRDNPVIGIWGTYYVSAEISFRNSFNVVNAHNSWIQALMLLGIPGLLVTVAYTVIAVWNLWALMWRKDEDISKKIVAMIVICLLLASVLEAYLFTGEDITNCENFLFFLCAGYLVQWNQNYRKKKT